MSEPGEVLESAEYYRGLLRAIYESLPGEGRASCCGAGGEPEFARLPGLVSQMSLGECGEGFGARLLSMRGVRGMSQQELSRLSGVKQGTISELERGVRRPRAGTVRRLAGALGCPAESLR